MNIIISPLFLIPAATGLIVAFIGILLLRFPPENINNWYGYRTRRSMSEQDAWDFAQRFSARRMIAAGTLLLLIAIPGFFIKMEESLAVGLGFALIVIALFIPIVQTEKALKEKFDRE
jgi:uncharacterized membrane protein